MPTTADVADWLAYGGEQAHVEFKAGASIADKALRARVIRAMLGLANLADGGHVVIGVGEQGGQIRPPLGMPPELAATWTRDALGDAVAEYADPPPSFRISLLPWDGDAMFAVVSVAEFDDIPILCKKDYQGPSGPEGRAGKLILRAGACYVRSRRKPETVEVPSNVEMRQLLDRAADKRVSAMLDRLQRLGLVELQSGAPTDADRYDEELRDLR